MPGTLVAARRNSPLVVGVGDGEMFLASDVAAFIANAPKGHVINGLALETRLAPDTGAQTRLQPVLAALLKVAANTPSRITQINARDAVVLTQYGAPTGGYDEVFYIEVYEPIQ